ncbi:prostaglandin-H2 D-isomerase-like [Pantherophis guttatus]|uniref:Prostaglandin-H2 D-isomerase-like n=1 Tax=Pantherophis guttatus TaxID=94885 RepID=A0A6P9DIS5_PANGU|nr:prostaglandin-H2 D-isomerase-like [Pantherophis guttatus]
MKSLLIALGLALCCLAQVEWEEVTTASDKHLGSWVNVAAACDSPDALEQIRHMSAFVAVLSKPREDVFSILAFVPMPDGCKKVTYQFRKGEDGKYHSHCDDTTVTVESLKALGESIMSIIKYDDFRTAILHSRTVTQDPEIIEKFKEECKRLGYSKDQIVVLNPTVKCQEE